MAHFFAHRNDPLLQELDRHEQELHLWLNRSPENAILFVEDPVSALRAAKLGIGEQILKEFEATMYGLLQKLGDA